MNVRKEESKYKKPLGKMKETSGNDKEEGKIIEKVK